MGSPGGVREMRHIFSSCERLTEIAFSGLDPSSLEDLAYTFGGCGSLTPHVPDGWTRRDGGLGTSPPSRAARRISRLSVIQEEGLVYVKSQQPYIMNDFFGLAQNAARPASARRCMAHGHFQNLLP